MTRLERYLKHERLYVAAGLTLALFINGTIIATSIIMEAQRSGRDFPLGAPFITEYTSHLAALLLVPLLIQGVNWFPLRFGTLRRNIPAHIVMTVLFCLAHIGLFVAMRKLVFGALGQTYIYSDDPLLSFIYEYRKDAWSYMLWIVGIHSYRFTLSRLRGEAVPVAESEEPAPNAAPERFLVRKLGREFIVRVDSVEWLEAAGNYVNLHVGERTYPLRATMNAVVADLQSRGFVRIHRSCGVNLDFVDSLTPQESGDAKVTLRSGHTLTLSRRYRDSFRQQLSDHGAGSAG